MQNLLGGIANKLARQTTIGGTANHQQRAVCHQLSQLPFHLTGQHPNFGLYPQLITLIIELLLSISQSLLGTFMPEYLMAGQRRHIGCGHIGCAKVGDHRDQLQGQIKCLSHTASF